MYKDIYMHTLTNICFYAMKNVCANVCTHKFIYIYIFTDRDKIRFCIN